MTLYSTIPAVADLLTPNHIILHCVFSLQFKASYHMQLYILAVAEFLKRKIRSVLVLLAL